ncbi:hypothetical protein TNCV_4229071 [Trichonephila clavipes]|nr:hypothetical protein TNCV_4229071 [Trichonephila clavipes]
MPAVHVPPSASRVVAVSYSFSRRLRGSLCQVYGLNIISKQMVRCWCKQFSKGRQSVHDKDGSHTAGRTAAVLTEFGWELFDQPPTALILEPQEISALR